MGERESGRERERERTSLEESSVTLAWQ